MKYSSRSEYILTLAEELLSDIELSRLNAESLLLKTVRLARLIGSSEIQKWLNYELTGYNGNEDLSLKYMSITGRWTNKKEMKGYWVPLAHIESIIESEKLKLSAIRIPDTSGEYAHVVINNVTKTMNQTMKSITDVSAIRGRVLGLLHRFVTEVYYEKIFENLSESIFEKYKCDVDSLIAQNCSDVLQQIPLIVDRLSENHPESVSQALNTCRRILDGFADSIYPPSEGEYEIDGNKLSLKADKHQNRINAFVHQKCKSKSRKNKIRESLANIYDRVSIGIHNDVSAKEAKSLFLNTYLILGEILTLSEE